MHSVQSKTAKPSGANQQTLVDHAAGNHFDAASLASVSAAAKIAAVTTTGAELGREIASFAQKRIGAHVEYWETVAGCSDPATYMTLQSGFTQTMVESYRDEWLRVCAILTATLPQLGQITLHPQTDGVPSETSATVHSTFV